MISSGRSDRFVIPEILVHFSSVGVTLLNIGYVFFKSGYVATMWLRYKKVENFHKFLLYIILSLSNI